MSALSCGCGVEDSDSRLGRGELVSNACMYDGWMGANVGRIFRLKSWHGMAWHGFVVGIPRTMEANTSKLGRESSASSSDIEGALRPSRRLPCAPLRPSLLPRPPAGIPLKRNIPRPGSASQNAVAINRQGSAQGPCVAGWPNRTNRMVVAQEPGGHAAWRREAQGGVDACMQYMCRRPFQNLRLQKKRLLAPKRRRDEPKRERKTDGALIAEIAPGGACSARTDDAMAHGSLRSGET
ncbi:hypothetical protein GGTG_09598 [Gaeumannomyces tritici R3-111a-1]|uniref:Uncharacterized protein n=1 Tax=Gaeumannomyces tritici (strain R3-111a-1) TaxID=644352 RepID=J3P7V8_GAET3|nr:hypothetical protein GGTG_09598 [Gaeumannomyces tritici R3-111a-1]EJT72741.1 hypothetical protein GGTG_09598 [Gaeumannomyces tritici R3-111a-1]